MAKHKSIKLKSRPSYVSRKPQPVVDEKVRQEKILPAVAALKSANLQDRIVALGALATLIEDHNMRHMLLKERLIKVLLSNSLSDSSLEIVSQAFGVLRNIVLAEGHDSAVFLVRESIKLPINSIAQKIMNTLPNITTVNTSDFRILSSLVENIFGLVSAILMTVGPIENFESASALGIEIVLNHNEAFSEVVLESTLEMIYYISEDLDGLSSVFDLDQIVNIKSIASRSNRKSSHIYGLGLDFNAQLSSGSDLIPVTEELLSFLHQVPVTEVNSIQICLELLAIAAQTDNAQQLNLIISRGFSFLRDNMAVEEFKLRAVNVLNNIGWGLNAFNKDWKDSSMVIFNRIISPSFLNFEDSELVSSCLNLVAAMCTQIPLVVYDTKFIEILNKTTEQIKKACSDNSPEWIGLSRSLIVFLGRENMAERFGRIGEASELIFLLLDHGDVEAQIDALNAMFVIFADNNSPYNEKEYKMKKINQRLEALKPSLKRSLKSTPKTNRFLRDQALDAYNNLEQFILYKNSE